MEHYRPLFKTSRTKNKIERSDMVDDLLLPVSICVVFHNRSDVLYWTLQERKTNLLGAICAVAASEGRLDILNEVLNNLEEWEEDDEKNIFGYVGINAAHCGQLNVLKWLETKTLPIGNCAEKASARHGQLHILQWLREEKGLQLNRDLYCNAALGGHLHVMKWLREQACPFHVVTFVCAARKGNLDILQWLHDEGCPSFLFLLQWLHDEGCPWDRSVHVYGRRLKPETLEWCRVNGYGNRVSLGRR